MSKFEIPEHLVFAPIGSEGTPMVTLPALPPEARRSANPWQIILHDMEDRQFWFTKWDEGGSLEGTSTPLEATQFMLQHGVMAGLKKAAELRRTQYNPDKLYIVNAERTSIAHLNDEESQ